MVAANVDNYRCVRDTAEGEQEWEFPCECGRTNCHERVFLTLDAYIELRDRVGIVLADGHRQSQVALVRRLRDNAD